MFKGQLQTPQKLTITKPPHEKLIEFLEKRGLKEEAYNLRKNATTLNLSLSLLNNKQPIGESGAKEIAEALKDNSTLSILNLYWNNIGDNGAKEIALMLKYNSTLSKLDLGKNHIGDSGAKEIAEALKDNSTLTELDLGFNNIGDSGAKEIAETLKDNSTLSTLNLGKNHIGESGAKEIALMLKYNSTLSKLDLGFNKIGESGAKEIAETLKDNSTLTELDLGFNNIGDSGAKEIAETLKDNSTLSKLNLGKNHIGESGAKEIALMLKYNSTLSKLDLGFNKIGESGAKEIALMLKYNSTLSKLDLSCNQIGESGAKELAAVLKDNSTLTTLDLRGNNIGDNGAQELAAVLKDNSTLTGLDLRGNNIGDNGAQELALMLKDNSTLTTLNLGNNEIGYSIEKEINKYLQGNINLAEKKAESLNAEGNDLCNQEKYNEAIEKYKAAIKITKYLSKENKLYNLEKYSEAIEKYKAAIKIAKYLSKENKLYKENKTSAEKKYEEQQQSLKLKQPTSVTNENKPAEKKEIPKQNIIQTSSVVQEKDIYELLAKMIEKLKNTPTIKDKDKLQNNIMNKIEKLGDNEANLQKIAKSIQGIIDKNKLTKGMLVDLEDEINEIIQEQAEIDLARIDKLNIFKQTVEKVITTLEKDMGIAANNKAAIKNSINKVISDVSRLTNISDIEKITASIKELTTGKITKGKLEDVEEEIEEIIVQQRNKAAIKNSINKVISDISRLTNISDIEKITASIKELTTGKITKGKLEDVEEEIEEIIVQQRNKAVNEVLRWAVKEIIYDKPLLNHSKLQTAVDKLSPDLIYEAINNNDDELILAGLISVGYDVTLIN